uniref:Uncharacterized protein n=1 Tax=Anguilla anguilla TaxID=7936 RepID=A0A0E9UZP9_ANGAN
MKNAFSTVLTDWVGDTTFHQEGSDIFQMSP